MVANKGISASVANPFLLACSMLLLPLCILFGSTLLPVSFLLPVVYFVIEIASMRLIFRWLGANWWRDAVAVVLLRNTALSKSDATSYIPRHQGAMPHIQSMFVPPITSWTKTSKVSIQLLKLGQHSKLGQHGLIPADLTSFMLIQWDINGRIVVELQRKHEDDYLGKE